MVLEYGAHTTITKEFPRHFPVMTLLKRGIWLHVIAKLRAHNIAEKPQLSTSTRPHSGCIPVLDNFLNDFFEFMDSMKRF